MSRPGYRATTLKSATGLGRVKTQKLEARQVASYNLRSERGEAFGAPLSREALHNKIAPFDVTEHAQRLMHSTHPERPSGLGQLIGGNARMRQGDAAPAEPAPKSATQPYLPDQQ